MLYSKRRELWDAKKSFKHRVLLIKEAFFNALQIGGQ